MLLSITPSTLKYQFHSSKFHLIHQFPSFTRTSSQETKKRTISHLSYTPRRASITLLYDIDWPHRSGIPRSANFPSHGYSRGRAGARRKFAPIITRGRRRIPRMTLERAASQVYGGYCIPPEPAGILWSAEIIWPAFPFELL